MAYADADTIRAVAAEAFEDTITYSDALLESWAATYGDPDIDSRLGAAGYDVPFEDGSVPQLVITISAMKAAAWGLAAHTPRSTTKSVERAQDLAAMATKWLDEICANERKLYLDGELVSTTAAGAGVRYASTGEDMHPDAVVVDDSDHWDEPQPETREDA